MPLPSTPLAGAAGPEPPKTETEWFQDIAQDAWRRGQTAFAAGQFGEALAWHERAYRIAPEDAGIALTLVSARMRAGDRAGAIRLLAPLAAAQDVRELWFSLASARHTLGAHRPAATALGRALSGHAVPAPKPLRILAGKIAAAAGYAGWCGLGEDGRLIIRLTGRDAQRPSPDQPAPRITIDGLAAPTPATGRRLVPQDAQTVEVTLGDRPLLGSPIANSRIRRIEGIVTARDGGLEGWAWYPAAPDTDPVLNITTLDAPTGNARRPTLAILADDHSMVSPSPLARPRRFSVIADQLRGMDGLIGVTGANGRHLLGSPLDPSADRLSANAAARAVASRFAAIDAANPFATTLATTLAAIPADIRGTPATCRALPTRPVVIVVPVYGNADLVRACLAAVAETLPPSARIIIVDDASPEPEIRTLLDELRRQKPSPMQKRWQVLRHPTNQGFPASANTGLRAAAALPGKHDMILLNSDTLVTAGWLEGLRAAVHAHADIGTATPLSNDATILSYPVPTGGNPVPPALALARLARWAATANAGASVEIPTAIGFCMYIRHECLRDVGVFRTDMFAQGYGEENDFCIRARHLGFRHVAVPGVFVAHVGGQSFGAARAQLTARNLAVLERLHPGYHALIAAYQAADPLADARRRIDMLRWRAGRSRGGAVLMITHASGGGVERVIRERSAALRAAGQRPITLRPVMASDGVPAYLPGLCELGDDSAAGSKKAASFPNLRFRVPAELPALARLLRGDRIERIEVHHLLGHDHAILRLAALLGVPRETHLHDYALFCPRISLIGRDGRYCGEPSDPAACEACVADLGRKVAEDIPIATLRARSAADLAASSRIVVPSQDAASRLRRHFHGIVPQVEPLEDDANLPPERPPPTGALRIGIIGGIGTEKGYDVLLACARNATARGLKLDFIVIGHTPDDGRLLDTGRIFVTGPYREAEVLGLIRDHDIHLAWQPSIWPETWCFTLGVAWRAGLRVAAFDIGAPAERIRRTGRGWLMPLGLPPPAINTALMGLRGPPGNR